VTVYRIKRLAELLPKSPARITAGDYQKSDYDQEVWDYQTKLKNLQIVEIQVTSKTEANLQINFEEPELKQPEPEQKSYRRKTKTKTQNQGDKLNDDSN
jgi:allophanate hydrolase subunit 1